jgi:hypothetical protein
MTDEEKEALAITMAISRALNKGGIKQINYEGDNVQFFYKGYRIDLLIKKDTTKNMKG